MFLERLLMIEILCTFFLGVNGTTKNIYGAFDSTSSPKGTATIFLSSTHSRKDVGETIKHEIYHYWQYRNCQVLEEISAYQFKTYHVVK